jgi:hypothetical protein
MRAFRALPIAAALLISAVHVLPAESVPVTAFGRPVTAIGSSTGAVPDCPALEGDSCYNTATGSVGFYIPLRTSDAGVFGVTVVSNGRTAGTFSDTGSGTGSSDALTMYLRFAPVATPPDSASLRFDFIDLDLRNANDPDGFFESVRFYDESGQALTPRITVIGQSDALSPLDFEVTGNSTSQSIYFPDVSDIVTDPFYIDLRFRSRSDFTGRNTIESMIATLVTETREVQVTEPGTLALLGAGLVLLGAVIARRL